MLSVESLSAAYNATAVFSNLSFTLGKGESLLLSGKNGSGKSTLCRILSGIQLPAKGKVKLQGKASLYSPSVKPYSKLSLKENITLISSDKFFAKRASNVCSSFDIKNLELLLHTLSSGNAAKFSLALCLAREAELYILDEPYTHLDKNSQDVLTSLIADKGSSCIIATHIERCPVHTTRQVSLDEYTSHN